MTELKDSKVAQSLMAEGILHSDTPSCPDCGSAGDVIEDYAQGNYVCRNCALVVGQVISDGSEWRSFADDGNSSKADPDRVGGRENELLADIGLSTIIGDDTRSGLGRTHNKGAMTAQHRALIAGFKKIQQIAGALNLPQSIIIKAQELFKRVEESKEIKKKGDGLIAASVFIACRQAKVPRTIKELCAVADVKKSDLSKCFNKIKELKLYKATTARDGTSGAVATQSSQLMPRFCSNLKLPPSVTKAATDIASQVDKLGLCAGKTPQTIAGASLYMACQLSPDSKRTYQQIHTVTQMSVSTITQAFQQIWPRRMDLVPEEYASQDAVQLLTSR